MYRFIDDLRKIPIVRILFPFVLGICCFQYVFPELRFQSSQQLFLYDIREETEVFVFGVLQAAPVEKDHSFMLDMEINSLVINDTVLGIHQKLIVYIKKSKDIIYHGPGDKLAISGKMTQIYNNGNPNEFDYKAYMARRGYYFTLFADSSDIHLLGHNTSLRYIPMKIRHKISSRWPEENQDAAILRALCLGDKSQLNIETKSDFSNAGAVHLLAVSGLHIGIVWWILDILLRFPKREVWRFLKSLVIVLVLWNYAAVTGFSESVCRSVLMFSLVAISKSLKRNANIYNTLFLSAFILLLIYPERISDPGFQLSYLAVFGIVTFQPKMQKVLKSRYKLLQWILDLVSVSIAAQISTLPLILYYFHQFPLYFILSNIISIPLVTVLLVLFVIFLPLFFISVQYCLPDKILLWFSSILNSSVDWIAALPGASIQDIPMQGFSVLLLLLSILSFAALIYYKRVVYLLLLLAVSSKIFIFTGLYWLKQGEKEQFQIYNFNSISAFSFQHGTQRVLFIFPEGDSLGYYEQKYFQSSFLAPKSLKSDVWISLNDASAEKFNAAEGLWSFEYGGYSVLLVGECDIYTLDLVLQERRWDRLIFRTGFPFGTGELLQKHGFLKPVYDATVQEWEMRVKKI